MTATKRLSILLFALIAPTLFAADAAPNLSSERKLGLNDLAILLPYNEVPTLFVNAPEISEKPSIASDGQTFVPAWILRKIGETNSEDFNQRTNEIFNFELGNLLNPEEVSEYKNLLPSEVRAGGDEGIYSGSRLKFAYRLTSIRFDPCADAIAIKASNDSTENCRGELRLVFQAVNKDARGNYAFVDNNIHAIYSVSQSNMRTIVKRLRALKTSVADPSLVPLGPQPDIIREGLNGAYYKGIHAIVQEFAHSDKLTNLAFLAQTHAGGHWTFVKFAISGKKAKVILVNDSGSEHLGEKKVQRITLSSFSGLGQPSPKGAHGDNIYEENDSEQRFEKAARLENPSLHDVADLDCASCHTIDHQRKIIQKARPDLTLAKDAYTSNHWNLSQNFPIPNFVSLQIFSYFPPQAVRITPRVIYETAESCDFVAEHY